MTASEKDHSQFNVDGTYPGVWTITFKNPPINMFAPQRSSNWEG